jgi:hypothetical protein
LQVTVQAQVEGSDEDRARTVVYPNLAKAMFALSMYLCNAQKQTGTNRQTNSSSEVIAHGALEP